MRFGCGALAISSSLELSELLPLSLEAFFRFLFPGSFVCMSLVGASSSLTSELERSATCSCVMILGAGSFGEGFDFDFDVDLEVSVSFLLDLGFDMGTPFLWIPMVGFGFSTFFGCAMRSLGESSSLSLSITS